MVAPLRVVVQILLLLFFVGGAASFSEDGVTTDSPTPMCLDPNCRTCVTPWKCLECEENYSLASRIDLDEAIASDSTGVTERNTSRGWLQCIRCFIPHCHSCSIGNVCQSCHDNFTLSAAGTECIECNIANCLECQKEANVCTRCTASHHLSDDGFRCLACNINQCMQCSHDNFCVRCTEADYVPSTSGDLCLPCTVPHCASCLSPGNGHHCRTCDKGFSLSRTCGECTADHGRSSFIIPIVILFILFIVAVGIFIAIRKWRRPRSQVMRESSVTTDTSMACSVDVIVAAASSSEVEKGHRHHRNSEPAFPVWCVVGSPPIGTEAAAKRRFSLARARSNSQLSQRHEPSLVRTTEDTVERFGLILARSSTANRSTLVSGEPHSAGRDKIEGNYSNPLGLPSQKRQGRVSSSTKSLGDSVRSNLYDMPAAAASPPTSHRLEQPQRGARRQSWVSHNSCSHPDGEAPDHIVSMQMCSSALLILQPVEEEREGSESHSARRLAAHDNIQSGGTEMTRLRPADHFFCSPLVTSRHDKEVPQFCNRVLSHWEIVDQQRHLPSSRESSHSGSTTTSLDSRMATDPQRFTSLSAASGHTSPRGGRSWGRRRSFFDLPLFVVTSDDPADMGLVSAFPNDGWEEPTPAAVTPMEGSGKSSHFMRTSLHL